MSNRLNAGELIHLLAKIDPATEIHWRDYDYDTDGYFQIYLKGVAKDGLLLYGDMEYFENEGEDEDD